MTDDLKALNGRIAVAIEGDPVDLDDACFFFSENIGVQVRRLHIPPNYKVVLLADDLNGLTDEGQIYGSAKRLINLVNGVLFLHDVNRKPVSLQGIVHRQAANGNWGVTVWATGLAFGRSRVRSDNRAPGQPTEQSLLLQRVEKNEVASDVLTHLSGVPEWFDLYKAFELMRADIDQRLGKGGRTKIGWPGRASISRFTQSAQVYRHAKSDWPEGIDQQSAMALTDARKFTQNLCAIWLKSL
jgi:hypothetical protein